MVDRQTPYRLGSMAFVGILILGLPRFVRMTNFYYYTDPIAAFEYVLHYLATASAMLLVFTTEARAWFRNKRP